MASKATLVLIPSDLVFAGKWANGFVFRCPFAITFVCNIYIQLFRERLSYKW